MLEPHGAGEAAARRPFPFPDGAAKHWLLSSIVWLTVVDLFGLVLATEFVTPEAGVLVDPLDVEALTAALRAAASFPRPNEAAREAARAHDVHRQAERVEQILSRAAAGRRA